MACLLSHIPIIEQEDTENPPPLVLWLGPELRRGFKEYKIHSEVQAWCVKNLHQNYQIVCVRRPIKWGHKLVHQKRYGVRFGCERDLVLVKMFWL
jgi:hypothetical protein